jgi:hypothetical protein
LSLSCLWFFCCVFSKVTSVPLQQLGADLKRELLTLRRNSRQQQPQQATTTTTNNNNNNNNNDGEEGGGRGAASTSPSAFSASSDVAAFDAAAEAEAEAEAAAVNEVVVFDRLRTLGNLGEAFPFKRLCGHGFSGPITDLHARLLLALLCASSLAGTVDRRTETKSVGTTEQGWWWAAPGKKVCSEVAAPESLPHWARTFH